MKGKPRLGIKVKNRHVKLKDGKVVRYKVMEVVEAMGDKEEKRRAYDRLWKRANKERLNEKRRARYATDSGFREKERARVRRATRPWSELTEEQKQKKRKRQREYLKRRYHSDPVFREKQKGLARKSNSIGFMRFGGFRGGKDGNGAKGKVAAKKGGKG